MAKIKDFLAGLNDWWRGGLILGAAMSAALVLGTQIADVTNVPTVVRTNRAELDELRGSVRSLVNVTQQQSDQIANLAAQSRTLAAQTDTLRAIVREVMCDRLSREDMLRCLRGRE